MITYRKAKQDDIRPALDLALRVFMEYEAAEYEPYATQRFKIDIVYNSTAIQNWANQATSMYIALDDERIVGVIGEKWRNGHINLLFVDGQYHRKGIATELMNHLICDLKLSGFNKITLFSSPYGLPFYLNYGFTPTDVKMCSDGFTFTPMEYIPNEIWDVLDEDGNKTGRFHERGRKMKTGDTHLVVHVWKLNKKGEWLIDRRSLNRGTNIDGKWETTGGSALAGEDSITAALREAKEELGIELDPTKGTLFCRVKRHNNDGRTCFQDAWIFEWNGSIDEIRFQENETCNVMWASSDQIIDMMAANQFLSKCFYPYFDEMVKKWTTAR